MTPNRSETNFESDRFEDTPHPRESYELFGHDEAEKRILLSYLLRHLPQAFIIGGPPGIGKATFAWRIARFLLAYPDPAAAAGRPDLFVPPTHPVARQIAALAHPDLALLRREWNVEKNKHFTEIKVDHVRRAIDMFHRAAGQGGYRVCILDCADDLNKESANALLKLVEEPPPQSLFLIVAHRPGRMLATLRSRCRRLLLKPLDPGSLRKVAAALGPPWSQIRGDSLDTAIAGAQGSIHNVLRLLDENGAALDANLRRVLDELPHINWSEVHSLADRFSTRPPGRDYEMMLAVIDDWLDAKVRQAAQNAHDSCVQRLAPYALVWEKLTEAAREAEIFNLDRRPLVLSLFAEMAAAARASSF
jgi:DNA polymerase-3 subunit delta'